MTFHPTVRSPSFQTLLLTRISIILAVVITALVSVVIVRNQLERYQIVPEQIPIANLKPWHALGR